MSDLIPRRRVRQARALTPRRRAVLNLEALEGRVVMAVLNVNSLADVLVPLPGVVTLRSAIEASNASPGSNTINLTVAGTYKLTSLGTATDNTNGELSIADVGNLTINNTSGGGVIVDGGGLNRVFEINHLVSATPFIVTFQDVEVSGGFANSGGGIAAYGGASVVLNDSTVFGNDADAYGGGVLLGFNDTGDLTLNDSQVRDNASNNNGGGIASLGTGTLRLNPQSGVTSNTAGASGGGVYLGGSGLAGSGAVISDNHAITGSGGGIENLDDLTVSINSFLIEDNVAGTTGGGYDGISGLTMTRSFVVGNVAGGNGGGVALTGGAGAVAVEIDYGAVQGNVSDKFGGGIFVGTGTASSLGLRMTGDLVGGNTAVQGGGIRFEADTLTLADCTFRSDRSFNTGAAVDVASTNPVVTVLNDLFVNNAAYGLVGSGGAIVQDAGSLLVSGSQFTGNTGENGGAIVFFGSGTAGSPTTLLTIEGSTFNANRAIAKGGALYLDLQDSNAVLINDTIAFNAAYTYGGGIFDTTSGTSDLLLRYDTINGNTAGQDGGGINQDSGKLDVENTILAGNTAGTTGPDYFYNSGTLVDNGGNLIGTNAGGGGNFSGSAMGAPNLGPLQDDGYNASGPGYGGRAGSPSTNQVVQTEALLPGSLGFGLGVTLSAPAYDERGFLRPGGGAGRQAIGAYEPQYATTATANQVYVENLYEVLFLRTGDAGGIAYWAGQISSGASHASVAAAFDGSQTYLTIEAGGLYQRYLDRTSDSTDVANYANYLAAGHTLEQATAIMVGGPEFRNDYGNDNDVLVEGLFLSTLGRVADASGESYWTQAADSGMSQGALATAFVNSGEYLTDLVQSDFATYLGRPAEPGAVTYFVPQLQSGLSSLTFLTQVIGSDEAFRERT